MWGVDILGHFPNSSGQAKWIIVAFDFFHQMGGSRTSVKHFGGAGEEVLLEKDRLQMWITQVYRVR
jgi:hypothetical protein